MWQGPYTPSTTTSTSLTSLGTQAAAIQTRVAEVEADITAVAKSVLCSRAECCSYNYQWSGTTLKCWSSLYTSYDSDPCRCIGVVQDLGTTTANAHEKNCLSQGAHLMSVSSSTANNIVKAYGSNMVLGTYVGAIALRYA
jgi:hypothetical protein